MSRHQALKSYSGRLVVDELAARGILIRSPSSRGVAEEAPGAYKDVSAVVDAAEAAGLAPKVVRTEPLICVKGRAGPRFAHLVWFVAPLQRACTTRLGGSRPDPDPLEYPI